MEIHKQCNKVNYVIQQSRRLIEQIKPYLLQKSEAKRGCILKKNVSTYKEQWKSLL